MASILPALRRAAPRLTSRLFECPHRQLPICTKSASTVRLREAWQATPKMSRTFQSGSGRTSQAVVGGLALDSSVSATQLLASRGSSKTGTKAKSSFFPKTSERIVAYWLLGSAASVFGIVVFGGLTRLTESGYFDSLSANSDMLIFLG